MTISRFAFGALLLLASALGGALPALAASSDLPLADPTWQETDPSWLQSNWRWQDLMRRPVAHAMMAPASRYEPTIEELQRALVSAAAHGDLTMVKGLVDYGADVNQRDADGYTALTWASQRGQAPVVQYLLDHFAQPNPADREGYTPLMWAAQEGQLTVSELLLAHGANPWVKDSRGLTPLMLARISGNQQLVTLLSNALQQSPAARRSLPTPP